MTRIQALLSGFAVVAICGFALPSLATPTPDATYSLDKYVGSGTPSAAPYGHVDLFTSGSNVNVSVTLAALDGFVNTGAGDWLMFDLSNFLGDPTHINSAITITNIQTTNLATSHFTYEEATLSGTTVHGLGTGGAGDWDFGILCSASCSSGGSHPDPGVLTFTVNNVTLADFVENGSGYYFSADLCTTGFPVGGGCGGANTTGNVVSDTGGAITHKAPEPLTISLFGAGLAGAAAMRRRKAKRG